MSSGKDPVCEWEKEQAQEVLRGTQKRLTKDHRKLANLLADAYQWVEPALVQGRHLNPVHHTAHVVDRMVEIMMGQLRLRSPGGKRLRIREKHLAVGILAALFHDAGNAFEPKDEEKIRTKDVLANPALKEAAIAQRSRHMQNGGLLVEAVMGSAGRRRFGQEEIDQVRRLVEHHDDPTIAELLYDKNQPDVNPEALEYLFVPEDLLPLEKRKRSLTGLYPLSAILREADRLWMLTVPGMVADLKRNLSRGNPWDPQGQIDGNVKRHEVDEWGLYHAYLKRACNGSVPEAGELAAEWGFEEGCGFYRTELGKAAFKLLQDEANAKTNEQWIHEVAGSWFLAPPGTR